MPGFARIANGVGQAVAAILSGNYAVIISIALVSLFPVYSGYFSLKYDNIAFDLPMHYFMGEQLAKGEMPVWFDTWNMGFPLQSIFCWGIFSSIFMFFAGINSPDASILHFELVFFIALSGLSFYKLLGYFKNLSRDTACFLSCAYMLSGFTLGSSQWMFYLSGMALLPLCIYFLLQLLRQKNLKYALYFPVSYLVFFTNTHVFLSVTGSYLLACIFGFQLWHFSRQKHHDNHFGRLPWLYPVLSLILLVLLCLPPVYYSLQLFPYLNRSTPITIDEVVFQSDYMHPGALVTLFLPHAALRWPLENTEGMMQSVYTGLLTPLLFLLAIKRTYQKPDAANIVIFTSVLFFLFLSFGHYLPLRSMMNYLPGFSYFRHPALFRLFFIGLMLVFIARNLKGTFLECFFEGDTKKLLWIYIPIVLLISIAGIATGAAGMENIWKGSLTEMVKQAEAPLLLVSGGLIQLLLLMLMLWIYHSKPAFLMRILILDLMLNGLFCLPFNTISSHSIGHLVSVLSPVEGNPVQQESPSEVKSFFTEPDGTRWEHHNCCVKKISTDIDIYNPLTGGEINKFLNDSTRKNLLAGQPVIFMGGNDAETNKRIISVTTQQPALIAGRVNENAGGNLVVQQMNFPGWKIYINDKEVPVARSSDMPFVSANVILRPGDRVKAEYRKPFLVFWAVVLNLLIFITLIWGLSGKFYQRLIPFIC